MATPVILVEIDQDFCANTYGEAPCTAGGFDKCFNTFASCQDPNNYDKDVLTLRFARGQADLPFAWGVIPSLQSVNTTPTQINPGGGDRNRSPLGSRATARLRFKDHPHSDFRVDKYLDERDYNPLERGTFWSKWLRRNPFYHNRPIRIKEGYIDESPENMTTRHYLIEEINGPTADGQVTIRAVDILALTSLDKAQVPAATEGELLEDISDDDDSLILINWRSADEYPPAIDFPWGFGTIRIGDEVMRYGTRSVDGDEITLGDLLRGADGTEAEEHDAGDNAQLCRRYVNENCWEVVRDLLQDDAGVPSEFVPFSDWEEEADIWLPQFTVTSLITEPEGVEKLLGELQQQCLFFLWWDERRQEVRLKALRPPLEEPTELNDRQHIKAGSWAHRVDDDQRISQVWIYYQPRNPTEDLDEPTNYRRLRVRINPGSESNDQYGERRVRRIFSRWLETEAQVINVAARMIGRYVDGAKYLRLRLDAKDRELWTGDVADVSLWSQVGLTGLPESVRYQVISAEEVQPGETVEYDLLRYEFIGRFAFWMEESAPDYMDASDFQRDRGAWWSDADGEMPDGTDGYEWI